MSEEWGEEEWKGTRPQQAANASDEGSGGMGELGGRGRGG